MRGFVYLVGCKKYSWYKIGRASNPRIRAKQLGILLPFELEVFAVWKTANCVELELYLHERHASQRINGEWFHFNGPELQALIQDDALPLFAERIDVPQLKRKVKPERLFLQLMKAWLETNNLQPTSENNRLAAEATRIELLNLKSCNGLSDTNIGGDRRSTDGEIIQAPVVQ